MAPAAPPGAAPAQRTARQRRPTGAPPPLPHPFRVTTTAWLLLAVAIVTCAFLFSQPTAWLRLHGWVRSSAPAPPVGVLTIFLMGAVYCLAVPGRPRTYAKTAVAVVLTVFCL